MGNPDLIAAPAGLAAVGLRFDQASELVVAYLKTAVPMGFWSVTRYDGERQVYLTIDDSSYGLDAGGSHPWTDSMCQYTMAGRIPVIAPDVDAVPLYRSAPVRTALTINSYVGIPIQRADGVMFGALCGLDPATRDAGLLAHGPLLALLCQLLAGILELDLQRANTERALELTQLEAETDALTGLLNRRGWDRRLEQEEAWFRRFGDPGSVVAIDLDGLKAINDSAGHAAGDDYLRLAARTLREAMRGGDILARVGGDEFSLLVSGITPGETAVLVARMQLALAGAGVSACFGHAPYTLGGGFGQACRSADEAMYAQKAARSPN